MYCFLGILSVKECIREKKLRLPASGHDLGLVKKPLPKLPVPSLQETFDKYLSVLEPIVDPEQYERTKDLVGKFRSPKGQGRYLQGELIKVSETKDNWAYKWWLDDMYMKIRLPLPINSNPGMVFPKQHFEDQTAQLKFTARLISGILDYKTIIDARGIPIDRARHKEKGQPLCMQQYYRLFTSYRVPGIKKDALISSNSQLNPPPEHIVIICRNQLFVIEVMSTFSRLSEDDLYTQLCRVAEMADEDNGTAEPVGILTAASRDVWAAARMKLMEDPTNRDYLDQIEHCLFVVCLDKCVPITFNHQNSIDETQQNLRDDVSLALQMLHGHGTSSNSCNRWFDKTMQFIVTEDGACGLNYEHSPSEGIAVVQLIEHVLHYMEELRKKKLPRMLSLCEYPFPRRLQFKLTPDIVGVVNNTKDHMDSLIKDLDLYILRFENFGKEFPKSQNMSPDSFIQLALQLTYYKIHKKLVSTYESASTRRFHLGRVDNIRANSPAALTWVRSMVERSNTTNEEKMALLRNAMLWQTEIMTQTILGHGMDCHMLGLKEMANELGLETPDVFKDESFSLVNHYSMSTSQVPTTMDAFMCYGPVVPDGYGICYNPHSDYIVVCISSFKSHTATRSDYFGFTLESSLMQMYELCMKLNESNGHPSGPNIMDLSDCSLGDGKGDRKVKLVRQKNAQNDTANKARNGSENNSTVIQAQAAQT
ncbi:hypothetical protein ScPMuIL_003813 [Solemya velum]